ELFLFVFFSSRRRHTRSKRDWSSDVCSSDLLRGVDQSRSTTGDDALFDGGTSSGHGVFDAVLALLELHLGGGADLDDGDTAGELGQALLQLLAIPVGVGVLDFGADL